jgi:hypothetical protein
LELNEIHGLDVSPVSPDLPEKIDFQPQTNFKPPASEFNLRKKMLLFESLPENFLDYDLDKVAIPEFTYQSSVIQQYRYEVSPNWFQQPDLFPNRLNVDIYHNGNFAIQSHRNVYQMGYEGVNALGATFTWQPNSRLSLSLTPVGGRYYSATTCRLYQFEWCCGL